MHGGGRRAVRGGHLRSSFLTPASVVFNRNASPILRIDNRLIWVFLALSQRARGYPAARSPSSAKSPEIRVAGCPGIGDRIKLDSLTGCYRNR